MKQRDGWGIPYDIKTASGRPLADDVSEQIQNSLARGGGTVTRVALAPTMGPEQVRSALAAPGADRQKNGLLPVPTGPGLGIELDDLAVEERGVAAELYYFGGARRSEQEVVEAFRPIAARIEADLSAIAGDDVTHETPNGAQLLDRMSIAQWLDRNGVSGWIRELLDVGYTTEYGLETGEQSALNLLMMIETDPDPFRIFGESDERFHVRGGNDRITTELAKRIPVEIETNTLLESVRELAGGTFACSVVRNGISSTIRAPQVLLTLPFTLLRRVDIRMDLPDDGRPAVGLCPGAVALLLRGERHHHLADAGHVRHRPLRRLAQRLQVRRLGRVDVDGEHHVLAGHHDLRHQPLRHDIAALMRARHGAQGVQYRLLGHAHPFT